MSQGQKILLIQEYDLSLGQKTLFIQEYLPSRFPDMVLF